MPQLHANVNGAGGGPLHFKKKDLCGSTFEVIGAPRNSQAVLGNFPRKSSSQTHNHASELNASKILINLSKS